MDFIAVDWGTTNRRIYRLTSDGTVVSCTQDDRGILAVAPGAFGPEIAAIRAVHGRLPMLLAGMIGSTRGWAVAPYVPSPAGLEALAANVCDMGDDIVIVPGVSCRTTDVMRGEEVQFLGAVTAGLAPPTSLLCQPGTHCKWAWMKDGHIGDFVTAMTGELFALLRQHSLLATMMQGADDTSAFIDGVMAAGNGDLLAALFGARAATLLGGRTAESVSSYISGLIIGTDVHSRRLPPGTCVYLLADQPLAARYSSAITHIGHRASPVDSRAAFVAGITALRKLIP